MCESLFVGRNFVSSICKLKPQKKTKNTKNLKIMISALPPSDALWRRFYFSVIQRIRCTVRFMRYTNLRVAEARVAPGTDRCRKVWKRSWHSI